MAEDHRLRERLLTVQERAHALPLVLHIAGMIAVVALAVALQMTTKVYAEGYRFLFFFAANATNALLWDRRVALAGTVVSTFSTIYFFVEPKSGLFLPDRPGDIVAAIVFFAFGCVEVLIISGFLDTIREARDATVAAKRADEEKGTLLVESNHRIKNNLQLMVALLSREMGAEDAEKTLESIRGKLITMSRLHDQLSLRPDKHIDMQAFLTALCDDLVDSVADSRGVSVSVSADGVAVPGRMATMLGLIVNELVTNAVKYAYAPGQAGVVSVNLEPQASDFRLVVADGGCGLNGAQPGLGRQLIDILVGQLGGNVKAPPGAGTTFVIVFPNA